MRAALAREFITKQRDVRKKCNLDPHGFIFVFSRGTSCDSAETVFEVLRYLKDYPANPLFLGLSSARCHIIVERVLADLCANLNVIKFFYPDSPVGVFADCALAIDCIDIAVKQPGSGFIEAIHKKYYSHKENCGALKFLNVVDPWSTRLVLTYGPVPAAVSDQEIVARSQLPELLPPNKFVVADAGFTGVPCVRAKAKQAMAHSDEALWNSLKGMLTWLVESFHSRMRNWNTLLAWRGGYRKLGLVYLTVANLVNIDILLGHPLIQRPAWLVRTVDVVVTHKRRARTRSAGRTVRRRF